MALNASRFVAGPDFYNYDMYGGLRPGGLVRFFSTVFADLVAATFTSSFIYIGARYGLLPMVNHQLQLTASQTEAMDRLVEVPAALAFFVGLYADAVPIYGYRRKSYMVLGMSLSLVCLAALGLGCLFADALAQSAVVGSSFSYVMMLLMGGVTLGSMVNFCSVHTAVVTLSQRESLEERGVFQADYLVVRAAGQMAARVLVYVIQHVVQVHEIALLLLVLMPLSLATIALVLRSGHEAPAARKQSLRGKCESYWKLTKQKAVWRILIVVASFAFFLHFDFPRVAHALRRWTHTSDRPSALLSSTASDVVLILTVLVWRWQLRNLLWKRFFALAPVLTIVPQLALAALVVPALCRHAAVYVGLNGLTGVASGVMALLLLAPVTEIIEEGSEGGVVGLALSFNTIFKIFASTLLTTIERVALFPVRAADDTTADRWSIASLTLVTCCVNSVALLFVFILPLQKLDAQLVRMYGGFTENAGALTATAFLTSLAYCVAYNVYIFSEAIE
ncbi:unnamed protein product [Hyaloperonospora brassicae]|uniref:Transmembrane protein n=1 Tax=Hyaloperonospora brassicae TaxID=162125 RepID=A0AAV0U4E7_HYABA|nr:unnamed protein product [Hyaloperonospora brassicae]CAI5738548.1 unnamed protein product [Hyaloperonospora brassicae]